MKRKVTRRKKFRSEDDQRGNTVKKRFRNIDDQRENLKKTIDGSQRLLYQKLQNLRQGLRTVDEYTTEFYQLLVHNNIQETQDQLVSRYSGGLRQQILDVVNLFDPITVSKAHQRAL
ncbi:hypothetical protein Q3G72_033030 [Acer saccharum]|nr:hypothetical protein Q3G72_033030 [Acer saccharum]